MGLSEWKKIPRLKRFGVKLIISMLFSLFVVFLGSSEVKLLFSLVFFVDLVWLAFLVGGFVWFVPPFCV